MNVSRQKITLILLILVTALMGFLAWGLYAPESGRGAAVSFRVSHGESLKSISRHLAEKKIVPSSSFFYYYMRLTGKSAKIHEGSYKLPTHSGIFYAAKMLLDPTAGGVDVQVREGLTIWQTAGIVASRLEIDSSEFVLLCTDTSFIDSLGLTGDTSLEGYLYPNTYNFPFDVTARQVIRTMVNQFNDIYKEIPKQGRGANFSRNELISLAAIVEKEAQVPQERARISAVFHNRIEQGIPLGADPTIRYAVRKFTGPIYQSELEVESPYNTRTHKGLTPGPICSPGKAAIEAAMNPSESTDLFFVAKWDGSGEHYFSKTNAEHDSLKLMVRNANKKLSNW